jgi:hypothetical protein
MKTMERIPQHIIDQMSQSLVGKRVQYRDITGVCDYFGYSFFESWGLQITLGRTPISNVDIKLIKVVS